MQDLRVRSSTVCCAWMTLLFCGQAHGECLCSWLAHSAELERLTQHASGRMLAEQQELQLALGQLALGHASGITCTEVGVEWNIIERQMLV